MSKRDMDLYHSRITQDDLNELIIKYKIPRGLYPRLPSKGFVMFELSDDAIGVYNCNFDFYGIELTVMLFRVFQTLCKQGDWFSFAKRRAPSLVCIDDRGTILDFMIWRHLSSVIDDLKPVRLPFYCTHLAAVDAVVSDPTLEDLAASNPCAKKRKASTSSTASGHVAKRTRNQSGGSAAPATEGPNTQDSLGKGIMTDADVAVAPSVGASHPRVSSGLAPSFKEIFGDAIHRDLFPFSSGPYYIPYPEGGIARNYKFTHKEWDAPHQPNMKEKFASLIRLESQVFALHRQVTRLNDKLSASDSSFSKSKAKGNERKKKIKSLTKSLDNLHAEMARLSIDLNWPTILNSEKDEEILRLKATPPAFASFFQGLKVSLLKFPPLLLKLTMISQTRILSMPLNLFVILQLEPEKLAHLNNVPTSKNARVSPLFTKESTMTLAFTSLKLPSDTALASFVAALEPNEEWVNGMVDGTVYDMISNADKDKLTEIFVQRISHAVDADGDLVVEGSRRISSGPLDVVVALFVGEKNDDLLLFCGSRVMPPALSRMASLGTFSIAGRASVEGGDRRDSSSSLMPEFSCFDYSFPYVFHVYGESLDIFYESPVWPGGASILY
uniref:Transposase (Putative), gypsy type n=1 Tax=Tanacetum cinerariifolium TaxID=118510 RepID=A0A6L2P0D3_TANCI|nr:hypothetical protein [Tanacetum cinerariifolium]